MDEKVAIRGQKVVLREKRIEDVANDYAWRVDEELSRLDATQPLRMSYTEYISYSKEDLDFPSPRTKRFAIDTLDGKHIGNCMYYDIDLRQGEAELGIMIGDRGYWSKGYGADSVASLLDHIFTATPLTRVYLHTLEWNHRAQRSFARAGFREVKRVRRSGYLFILMEIYRSEWEQRALAASGAIEDGRPDERGAGSKPNSGAAGDSPAG